MVVVDGLAPPQAISQKIYSLSQLLLCHTTIKISYLTHKLDLSYLTHKLVVVFGHDPNFQV